MNVDELAEAHLVIDAKAPQVKHWTQDNHFPGIDCLSMDERTFGRALALDENLYKRAGELCRVGLHETFEGSGVWDCYTPNKDATESHHRIYEAERRVVKVEINPATGGELELPPPFSVWANLDAAPRWETDGQPGNLVAVNKVRTSQGKPPMVATPGFDKHLILLLLARRVRFSCFRQGGSGSIHPSALREFTTGYSREREDWLPAEVWAAQQEADTDPWNPYPGTVATGGSPDPYAI